MGAALRSWFPGYAVRRYIALRYTVARYSVGRVIVMSETQRAAWETG